jgi:hypothetical protein
VLKSIQKCDLSGIDEDIRVVVVNNYPPNSDAVDEICGHSFLAGRLSCKSMHREQTLPPVENWYSAIDEHAQPDEVVFLHGDDDLFLPWGIRDRFLQMAGTKADMLLSDVASRLYFYDHGRKYWLTGPLPSERAQAKSARPWECYPARHPEASFVGNHCYRNSTAFRRGLALAFEWCGSQTWLAWNVRTLMLPFYLPNTITLAGGTVVSLQSKCVLRGASAEETMRSPYGVSNWNTAFCALCAYDIFANKQLRFNDERQALVCDRFRRDIVPVFLTMLFDRRIALKTLWKTLRHSGFPLGALMSIRLLYGLRPVAAQYLGATGLRLRIRGKLNLLTDMNTFFK